MGDDNCTNIIENACTNPEKRKCENNFLDLSNIDPNQLATLANIAAILLSNDRSVKEINVIGNFIIAVGTLMLTISAQREALETKEEKLKEISDLKKQIKKLEDGLK